MAIEPKNHTPDIAVGFANMPAPIAVPAIIIAPPTIEGTRWGATVLLIVFTL